MSQSKEHLCAQIFDKAVQHFKQHGELYPVSGDDMGALLDTYKYFTPGMSGVAWIDSMTPDQLLLVAGRLSSGGRIWIHIINDDDGVDYWKPGTLLAHDDGTFSVAISGKDKFASALIGNTLKNFVIHANDGATQTISLPPPEDSGVRIVAIIPFAAPLISTIGALTQQLERARKTNVSSSASPAAASSSSELDRLKRDLQAANQRISQLTDRNDRLNEELEQYSANNNRGNNSNNNNYYSGRQSVGFNLNNNSKLQGIGFDLEQRVIDGYKDPKKHPNPSNLGNSDPVTTSSSNTEFNDFANNETLFFTNPVRYGLILKELVADCPWPRGSAEANRIKDALHAVLSIRVEQYPAITAGLFDQILNNIKLIFVEHFKKGSNYKDYLAEVAPHIAGNKYEEKALQNKFNGSKAKKAASSSQTAGARGRGFGSGGGGRFSNRSSSASSKKQGHLFCEVHGNCFHTTKQCRGLVSNNGNSSGGSKNGSRASSQTRGRSRE